MNNTYARKTAVDFSAGGPKVYHEWEVFEFCLYNFPALAKRRKPYHPNKPPRWHGHDIGFKVDIPPGQDLVSISATHPLGEAQLRLRIKDADEAVVFEGAAVLEVKRSSILDPSKHIIKDRMLSVELWARLDGVNNIIRSCVFTPMNPFNQNMLKLFLDEDTADVFFIIKEKQNVKAKSGSSSIMMCAHLAILKVCAPALADVCKGSSKANPVPISDVKLNIFKHVLYYVYGGKVPLTEMMAHSKEIMEAADRYDIPALKVLAEGHYVKTAKITVENFVNVYQYAVAKNFALLKEAALDVFTAESNDRRVLQSSSYLKPADSSSFAKDLHLDIVSSKYHHRVDQLRRDLHSKGLDIDGTQHMMHQLHSNHGPRNNLKRKSCGGSSSSSSLSSSESEGVSF